jgi:inositol transport system substrate-binding protein
MNIIAKYPDLWAQAPVEIPTKWDANVALANLQSAMQANPKIDFLFTSSDFLFPVIKSVLAPLNKWNLVGHPNHVILGGLDGDVTAARLLEEGYLDATGVQNLFYEADLMLEAMLSAIKNGEKTPDKWMDDPGFALTQANLSTRAEEMWGWVLYKEGK